MKLHRKQLHSERLGKPACQILFKATFLLICLLEENAMACVGMNMLSDCGILRLVQTTSRTVLINTRAELRVVCQCIPGQTSKEHSSLGTATAIRVFHQFQELLNFLADLNIVLMPRLHSKL